MEGIKECESYVKKEGVVSRSPSVSGSDNGVPKPISSQGNDSPDGIFGRITGPRRRSTKGGWTEAEDKKLTAAVQQFRSKSWKKIAECVSGRTDVQCLHRWQKVLNPSLVKGPWRKEEDDLIIELVAKKGKKNWSEISKSLPGRIGKQCRERWHNHLNPNIKKTAWTEEEELILIQSHKIYGNKWAEIAKFMHGRSENSIKNHWNSSVGKKADSLCLDRVFYPYYHKKNVESRDFKEIKQSLDQKVNLEGSSYTCSPETISDDDNATSRGLSVGQCLQGSANKGNASRESHNISSMHQVNFPVPFGALSVPLQRSCSLPSDVHSCKRITHNFIHELPPPVIAKRLPESSYGPQGNTCSADNSRNRNSKLSDQSKNHLSPRMTHEHKVVGAPENLVDPNHGCLYYKPLLHKDLNIRLEAGRFPSTDSYVRTSSSPVSFCTPPRHNKGANTIDCSSLESRLRSAARSYNNTPSIIRKRSLQCSRKIDNAHHNDVCSQEEIIRENFDNSPHLLHLCPRPCDKHDTNRVVVTNEKELFLPPSKSKKLEAPNM